MFGEQSLQPECCLVTVGVIFFVIELKRFINQVIRGQFNGGILPAEFLIYGQVSEFSDKITQLVRKMQ